MKTSRFTNKRIAMALPKRSRGAYIFDRSTPERYGDWLDTLPTGTRATNQGDERIVFVNT